MRCFHSTETALVKAHNHILRAVDNNDSVVLLLLDLSAAFDTVDHSILLSRLALRFGVDGQMIAWIESYLKDRKQFVQIENTKSCSSIATWRTTGFRTRATLVCSIYNTNC